MIRLWALGRFFSRGVSLLPGNIKQSVCACPDDLLFAQRLDRLSDYANFSIYSLSSTGSRSAVYIIGRSRRLALERAVVSPIRWDRGPVFRRDGFQSFNVLTRVWRDARFHFEFQRTDWQRAWRAFKSEVDEVTRESGGIGSFIFLELFSKESNLMSRVKTPEISLVVRQREIPNWETKHLAGHRK